MTATLTALVTAVVIGIPIAVVLLRGVHRCLLLGGAFLLGMGATGYALLVLSLLGVSWSPLRLALVVLPLILLVWFYARGRNLHALRSEWTATRNERFAARLFDLLTVVTVVAHGLYATSAPLWEWDYVANWGLKAKVFHEFTGIDWAFLKFRDYAFMFPDYPPLVPLLHDFVTLVRGAWEDRAAGLLATAFGAATVLLVRGVLEEEIERPLLRSLATLAVASPALTLWVGLAEGPLLAYMTGAVLLARCAFAKGRPELATAAALLLGFALLCKNEASALLIAIAAATVLTTPHRWKNLVRLWPAVALFLPWIVVRMLFDFAPIYLQAGIATRLARQLPHWREIFLALVRFPPDKAVLWLTLLLVLVWRGKWIWRRERFLAVVLLVQLAFYIAQNFLTPFVAVDHITYSWHRLMYQIAVPLVFLAISALSVILNPFDSLRSLRAGSASEVKDPQH